MKTQYFDPNTKTHSEDEETVEHEEVVNSDEEVTDGEEHEWVNESDLDAVDPDDIALGEEYF